MRHVITMCMLALTLLVTACGGDPTHAELWVYCGQSEPLSPDLDGAPLNSVCDPGERVCTEEELEGADVPGGIRYIGEQTCSWWTSTSGVSSGTTVDGELGGTIECLWHAPFACCCEV